MKNKNRNKNGSKKPVSKTTFTPAQKVLIIVTIINVAGQIFVAGLSLIPTLIDIKKEARITSNNTCEPYRLQNIDSQVTHIVNYYN